MTFEQRQWKDKRPGEDLARPTQEGRAFRSETTINDDFANCLGAARAGFLDDTKLAA